MKIVLIHGQNHHGSTYHIARSLAEKIGGDITEFFLPRDFGEFCTGCTNCFLKSETKCPHYEKLSPVTAAIDAADVIILASPVYVFHATGAMKAFLDHYGWRWMVHSPEASMFHKQGVCISTAAGMGMKSANQDMKDSLFFWGVARIYTYGNAVAAIDWSQVTDKKRQQIEKKMDALASKIKKRQPHLTPGIKTKGLFYAMRMFQKTSGYNPRDMQCWKDQGWLEKKRPWN